MNVLDVAFDALAGLAALVYAVQLLAPLAVLACALAALVDDWQRNPAETRANLIGLAAVLAVILALAWALLSIGR